MNNWKKVALIALVFIIAIFIRNAYPTIAGISGETQGNGQGLESEGQSPVLVPNPQNPTTGAQDTSSTGSAADLNHFTRVGDTPLPAFAGSASLVADLSDGAIISSVNPNTRWPTASLTKLITATLVFDNIPTSTRITISPEMFAVDPTEATLAPGGTYTVEGLLHVLLMPSSNVAAEAFADYFGYTQFMALMNARAAAWGMTNTHFDDPSGLSSANESTAADMLIVAEHVYKDYPQILAITRTPQTTITELESRTRVPVKSINDFAGEANFIGGKTGHTTEASGNLLSIFNVKNEPIMIIVLGTTDRFGDTTKLLNWFTINYR